MLRPSRPYSALQRFVATVLPAQAFNFSFPGFQNVSFFVLLPTPPGLGLRLPFCRLSFAVMARVVVITRRESPLDHDEPFAHLSFGHSSRLSFGFRISAFGFSPALNETTTFVYNFE